MDQGECRQGWHSRQAQRDTSAQARSARRIRKRIGDRRRASTKSSRSDRTRSISASA